MKPKNSEVNRLAQYSDEYIQQAKKMLENIENISKVDEEIEKEKEGSILDNYTSIFGIHVEFEDITLFDNKARIRMPKSFYTRTQAEIKEVYFLGQSPQIVFSDGILPFMVSFNYTENKISNHEIEAFSKSVKNMIQRVGSKSKIMGEQFLKHDHGNIFILETLMQTLDGVSFNLLFFTSIEEKLCIGSIVFDSKYSKRLIAIAKEMTTTFEILVNKDGEKYEHNSL